MTTQTQKDTRPYISEEALIAHLEPLSDEQLSDPGPVLAELRKIYRLNDYTARNEAANIIKGRKEKAEISEIGRYLELHTGRSWQIEKAPKHRTAGLWQLRAPDGYTIRFLTSEHATNGKNRFNVYGVYSEDMIGDDHLHREDKKPDVTMSRERGPAALAADIYRRVWQDYKEIEDRNRKAIKQRNARISQYEQYHAMIASVLDCEGRGTNYHAERKKGETVKFEMGQHDTIKLTATLHQNQRISVSIERLEIEAALDLLQMLKTIQKAELLAQQERERCPNCGGIHSPCYDKFCSNPIHCDGSGKVKVFQYCDACERAGKQQMNL